MKRRLFTLASLFALSVTIVGCAPAVAGPNPSPTTVPTEQAVERLLPTATLIAVQPEEPTPAPESSESDSGELVEGWVGTIVDLPPGNQFGQIFERHDGEQFHLGTPNDPLRERVVEARSTGAKVKLWGTLHTGVPADESRTIELRQIEFVSASPPEDNSRPIDGWTGAIYKLPPGNRHGRVFIRDDGEQYWISGSEDTIRQTIGEATWSGAQIRVWGTFHTGGPAPQTGTLDIDRIEIVSRPAPEARDLSAFARVTASSHLPGDQYGTYGPYAAIDGLKETSWVEGVSGPGIGEWIQLTFPDAVELRALEFDVGFDESADLFAKNNRIKKATLVLSQGEQTTVDFEDAGGLQHVDLTRALGRNVETTSITVIIQDVYPGTKYDDTCLAEITVWGVTR